MDHRDSPLPLERLGLDRGTGLHLSYPRLLHLLPLPSLSLHSQRVSRRPRAPVRPPRPARATDHPAPATGAPLWGKRPAVLRQTHRSRAPGTGWGPSPAPWGSEVEEEEEEGTEGTDLPVWENLVANNKQ